MITAKAEQRIVTVVMLFYVRNVAYISEICHGLDVRRILVRFPAQARDLSLLPCVQTDSGIYPASR